MQKSFGFCILFKEYIQNTNKIAKNPLSFAPKLPKIGKIGKIGCYFPAFSFLHLDSFCLYTKLVTLLTYIMILKTAHIHHLSNDTKFENLRLIVRKKGAPKLAYTPYS